MLGMSCELTEKAYEGHGGGLAASTVSIQVSTRRWSSNLITFRPR